jgi:hypothetical protein
VQGWYDIIGGKKQLMLFWMSLYINPHRLELHGESMREKKEDKQR